MHLLIFINVLIMFQVSSFIQETHDLVMIYRDSLQKKKVSKRENLVC